MWWVSDFQCIYTYFWNMDNGSLPLLSQVKIVVKYCLFLADPPPVGSALHLLMLVHVSVCVCVCRQLNKLFNIFGSGWFLFQKFLWHNPRMFVHQFKMIMNFSYVCHSVSWLTSLQKLDKHRDISSYGWYIVLKFLETFLGCWHTNSK